MFLGDLNDFFSISPFDKSRDRASDLQYEIDSVICFFMALRSISPNANIHWIMGNHEARLQKFLNSSKLRAIQTLKALTMQELFQTEKHNIKLVPYSIKIANWLFKHGEACGKHPAKAEIVKELCNGFSGHAHKSDYSRINGHDSFIEWYSLGTLAEKKLLDKHYSQGLRWNGSLGLMQHDNKASHIEIIQCTKKGFYCNYNKKEYKK